MSALVPGIEHRHPPHDIYLYPSPYIPIAATMDNNPLPLEERCKARAEAAEQAGFMAAATLALALTLPFIRPEDPGFVADASRVQDLLSKEVEKHVYNLYNGSVAILAQMGETECKLAAEVAVRWVEKLAENSEVDLILTSAVQSTLLLKVHLMAASDLNPTTTSQIHDDYRRALAKSMGVSEDKELSPRVLDGMVFYQDENGELRYELSDLDG